MDVELSGKRLLSVLEHDGVGEGPKLPRDSNERRTDVEAMKEIPEDLVMERQDWSNLIIIFVPIIVTIFVDRSRDKDRDEDGREDEDRDEDRDKDEDEDALWRSPHVNPLMPQYSVSR